MSDDKYRTKITVINDSVPMVGGTKAFYDQQNEMGLLPEIEINFNPELLIFLVVVPTLFFAVLAVLYSFLKLKQPALNLLTSYKKTKSKIKKHKRNRHSESNTDSVSF